MTVTGADISLSASHSRGKSYRHEESLLVGFGDGEEEFPYETAQGGRLITHNSEQSEAFSDASVLDLFQSGENVSTREDTKTQYFSSLRALQADFSTEAKPFKKTTLLASTADTDVVESVVPSDLRLSAKDRARIELIVTIIEELTGKRIKVTDPEQFLERRTVDTQLDPLTTPPSELPQIRETGSDPQATSFGLRVFVQDGAGNRQLSALGASGVEAIYLGLTSTPFEIKNEQSELQGVVRETGIDVGKDGEAGTVQQIDLVA